MLRLCSALGRRRKGRDENTAEEKNPHHSHRGVILSSRYLAVRLWWFRRHDRHHKQTVETPSLSAQAISGDSVAFSNSNLDNAGLSHARQRSGLWRGAVASTRNGNRMADAIDVRWATYCDAGGHREGSDVFELVGYDANCISTSAAYGKITTLFNIGLGTNSTRQF
jgi:hypothetical protein